jgi:uncharacterized protein YciI
MYAVAILRYRRPLDEVVTVQDAHRAYTARLKAEGTLVASGPCVPRTAGVLLLRVPDEGHLAALDRVRDEDPYTRAGMVQYEILPGRRRRASPTWSARRARGPRAGAADA